jgi:hypothetical protein
MSVRAEIGNAAFAFYKTIDDPIGGLWMEVPEVRRPGLLKRGMKKDLENIGKAFENTDRINQTCAKAFQR